MFNPSIFFRSNSAPDSELGKPHPSQRWYSNWMGRFSSRENMLAPLWFAWGVREISQGTRWGWCDFDLQTWWPSGDQTWLAGKYSWEIHSFFGPFNGNITINGGFSSKPCLTGGSTSGRFHKVSHLKKVSTKLLTLDGESLPAAQLKHLLSTVGAVGAVGTHGTFMDFGHMEEVKQSQCFF